MAKIEKLTREQIARFPEFVDQWTKIGLCTEAADRPRAEAAICEMYKQGGLKPPKTIIWCGSPLSQGITRSIILSKEVRASVWDSVGDSVGDSVWDSVGDRVGDSVGASVWDSVRDSVRDSVGASVWDSVWDSVGDSVWDSVGDSVGASVWDSVWDSVGASVWDSVGASVGDSVYGQHDAAWLAFYHYFFDAIRLVDQTKKLSGLWALCRSSGWALPHQNICWVSERHHILARDERGRLHSLAGPACAYPDGWAIYAVHGVRVPASIVEDPKSITVKLIDAERNAEVRRVMIDRYRNDEETRGAAAYVRDTGGKRLDHDERYGTLWRREVHDDEPIVMLEVINSTREPDGSFTKYWLRVDPNITKAHDAVAWTFGVEAKEYAPGVET